MQLLPRTPYQDRELGRERLHLPQSGPLVPSSQEQMRHKAEGHGKRDFEAGPVSSTDSQKPLLERQAESGEARGKASCELDDSAGEQGSALSLSEAGGRSERSQELRALLGGYSECFIEEAALNWPWILIGF